MVVGKQRQQAQHSHDFELKLVRPVRHPLRQRMQMQIQIADSQNGADQEDSNAYHQDVGFTWSGDEAWQMVGGGWMKGFAHATLPFLKADGERKCGGRPAKLAYLHMTGTWQAQV